MTAIVGYIAVQDLTKASDIIRSRTFDAFFPLIMVAVLYFIMAWLLTSLLEMVRLKTAPRRRRRERAQRTGREAEPMIRVSILSKAFGKRPS
jgi:polar amino acid transport system substrate-binding protein